MAVAFVSKLGLGTPETAIPPFNTKLITDDELDTNMLVAAVNGALDSKLARVDYSTAERDTGLKWVDGKKIYQKTVDCGTLPASGGKTVAHDIANIAAVISADGVTSNATSMMVPGPSNGFVALCDETNITIYNDASVANTRCYLTLLYTCTNR